MKNIQVYLKAIIFLMAFNFLHGQEKFLGHSIQFTPKTSPARTFDEAEYRKRISDKYKPVTKKEEDLKEFTDMLVDGKKYYLNSNTEYEKWDSVNKYLTAVLAKLKFDEPIDNFNIRVIRDPSVNACAFEDGTIFVNVGMLACFDTEAELAAILGHEIGHVLKGHAYKHFKAKKQFFKESYVGMLAQAPSSRLAQIISARKYSNRLVSDEKESDDVAVACLKASQYNIYALASVFERFTKQETKYDALKSYERPSNVIYIRTHPAPASRLKKASKLDANAGKNFLVDSIFFTRLKKQCIDESINLNFESLDFYDCIEQAFVQHLKYPNDPFYLFYLTESTRRLIELDKTVANKYFITDPYQPPYCRIWPSNKKPLAKTGGTVKPFGTEYFSSIFFKLCGPLLETDSSDYKEFKNRTLLKTDTLPFLTNADALNYFKEVNAKNNYGLNNLYLGTPCTKTENEKEKFFCGLPETSAEYQRSEVNNKILWVLYDFDHIKFKNDGRSNDEFKIITDTEQKIYEEFKQRNYTNYLSFGEELDFNERNSLINNLGITYSLIKNQKIKEINTAKAMSVFLSHGKWDPEDFITREQADFNFSLITPELIYILKKYNYKGLVFSSISISDETTSAGLAGTIQMEYWTNKHFYLDTKANKVKFYMSRIGNTNYDSKGFLDINSILGLNKKTNFDLLGLYFDSIKDISK